MVQTFDNISTIDFAPMGDDRGELVVIEGKDDRGGISFEIRRVFYIYGSDSHVIRGKHANRKTEFILINVSGTSKVKVMDGKGREEVYVLDVPNKGIYLPPMVWKEMYDFSADSVLLVLASQHYDSSEYIRSYDECQKEVNQDE